MAFTIVRVSSGGLPVVESDRGLPYYEADNGYGIPVTFGSTGIPLGGEGAYNIPSLWSVNGINLDLSQTDRFLKSDQAGTAASSAGDSIAFAGDDHNWAGSNLATILAAQAEIVTNGDFSVDASWTKGASVTISGGVANLPLGGGYIEQGITTVAGASYRCTLVGAVRANFGGAWDSTGQSVLLSNSTAGRGVGASAFQFAASDTTSFVAFTATGSGDCTIDDVSCKVIPGNHGIQNSSSPQPKRQAGNVARFDGVDDNLLFTYKAQSGANCIIAKVNVPATISATQVVAGASGSGANRCFIGFDTSGNVVAGVGSDSTTTIKGSTDRRGQTVIIGLAFDGSTVRLFDDTSGVVYEAAQNSTPTTSVPFRVGALNNNGTAGSFFSGDIQGRLIVGTKMLTASQFASIRNQLASA